ncbi:MAG: right-handed parallel beta-helix repeat-containing protein [Deltaproteobacteria bacterium]|nr:right-handed parallel beta-helix repeat-containing protein [Deltaproteobacteria bacterium]MBW2102427.1 right-handed parallel beta-helix repeat-containing protein [Deltaproteobacteria bacterium]
MKKITMILVCLLAALVMAAPGYAGTCAADLTGDGNVDGADLALLASEFGTADCTTTLTVDCDSGDTIADALAVADPGDTILVTGTCEEAVLLISPDHDRVVLDGQGSAVISSGGQNGITVDGTRGVVIRGFTVQNGQEGVLVTRGASALLDGLTVKDCADDGIQVDENANALIKDCTVGSKVEGEKIQGDGILVVRGSNATVTGTFTSVGNGGMGISVTNSSSLFAFNSSVTLQNNGWHGCGVSNGSALRIYGTADWAVASNSDSGVSVSGASQLETYNSSGTILVTDNGTYGLRVTKTSNAGLEGATLEVRSNGFLGLLVENSSSLYMGNTTTVTGNPGYGVCVVRASVFRVGGTGVLTAKETSRINDYHPGAGIGVFDASSFSAWGKVTLQDNESDGLMAYRGAIVKFYNATVTSITNNGRNGIGLYRNSTCDMDGGVTISSNVKGVVADDSTLSMSQCSVTDNPSGANPTHDVGLYFGARGTFSGNSIGNLECDGTALSRGDRTCP